MPLLPKRFVSVKRHNSAIRSAKNRLNGRPGPPWKTMAAVAVIVIFMALGRIIGLYVRDTMSTFHELVISLSERNERY